MPLKRVSNRRPNGIEDVVTKCEALSKFFFSDVPCEEANIKHILPTAVEVFQIWRGSAPISLAEAMVQCGLAESLGRARNLISGKAVRVNRLLVVNPKHNVTASFSLLSKGKKNHEILVLSDRLRCRRLDALVAEVIPDVLHDRLQTRS